MRRKISRPSKPGTRPLGYPRPKETLSDWAKKQPEFVLQLVDFADTTIKRADSFAQLLDDDDMDKVRDRETRMPAYQLAKGMLELAEKLDPSSRTTQRLLARTDEIFGAYASAYGRLSRLIDSAADQGDDLETIFFCRKLRGRVTFLLAESDRQNSADVDKETVERLEQAVRDLDICDKFLVAYPFDTDQPYKEYQVRHDMVRANLTLAEVEIDLSLRPKADASRLKQAEKHLRTAHLVIPELTKRAKYLKLRPSTQLTERWSSDFKRLHATPPTSSPPASPKTAFQPR